MTKILSIQPLGQRDARWKSQRLGWKDATSIGSDGCVITSASMMYTWYGKTTTPDILDNFLTGSDPSKTLYYNGNLWVPASVNRWYAPMGVGRRLYCQNTPAPLNEIKAEIDADRPCFLWVINGGVYHCILAVGYEEVNGKLQIIANDPWIGDQIRIDKRWGDSASAIQEINMYTSTAKPVGTVVMVQVPSPDFERMVNKSGKWDYTVSKIMTSTDPSESYGVERVEAYIADLKKQLQEARSRLDNLQDQTVDGQTVRYWVTEAKNRTEQSTRLKTEVDQLHSTIDELTKLVESGKGASKSVAELQQLTTTYKAQIDEMGKKLGAQNITISQQATEVTSLKTELSYQLKKIDELKAIQDAQVTPDQYRDDLSVAEVFRILFTKLSKFFSTIK